MRLSISLCLTVIVGLFSTGLAQDVKYERERHREMLGSIQNDVKNNYYDPNLKGIDIEAKYKTAVEKINKAETIGQMSGIIAQFLLDFDDSHLFFSPPGKVNEVIYGFEFFMSGDKCLIHQLDEESDASKKGLQIGDQIVTFEGFAPSRENLWKLRYAFYTLRPRAGLKLNVIKPDGKEVAYEFAAKIKKGTSLVDFSLPGGQEMHEARRKSEDAYRKSQKQYYYDKIPGVFIWKMPSFALDPVKVDDIMNRVKKYDALVLDLRGNGGGRVDMLKRLAGSFFVEDVKIGDEKKRKETEEVIGEGRGKEAFKGKLVVLIDSASASAAEVFAKIVQLQKRGTVIGDKSMGAVMESRYFGHHVGADRIVYFGSSITIADLIMTDGKSLEKVGVQPDLLMLMTAKDLAEKKDPLLAKAVQSLGGNISGEEAGKLFPEANKYDPD